MYKFPHKERSLYCTVILPLHNYSSLPHTYCSLRSRHTRHGAWGAGWAAIPRGNVGFCVRFGRRKQCFCTLGATKVVSSTFLPFTRWGSASDFLATARGMRSSGPLRLLGSPRTHFSPLNYLLSLFSLRACSLNVFCYSYASLNEAGR